PTNGLAFWPVLCQSARAPLSFTHKRSFAEKGLSPMLERVLALLSKSAIAAMCQVGPVNGRLTPFVPARRPPLPSSSQIALSPKLSNRNRSPSDPEDPGLLSELKFPRIRSVRVVMAFLSQLFTHDESFA